MASDSSQYGFSDRYQTSDSNPFSSSTAQEGSRAPVVVGSLGVRRRKVPESVTLNACTNCKKARAKVPNFRFSSLDEYTEGFLYSVMGSNHSANVAVRARSIVTTKYIPKRRKSTWFVKFSVCKRKMKASRWRRSEST